MTILGDDTRAYYADFANNAAYLEDRGSGRRILESAIIFHYGFRSEADFQRRTDRGVLGDFYAQGAWVSLRDNGGVPNYLREVNAVEDRNLADFWQARIDRVNHHRIVPRPRGFNLALGRPATQSSISQWSNGKTLEADAGLAVDGVFRGNTTFHTDCDDQAWRILYTRTDDTPVGGVDGWPMIFRTAPGTHGRYVRVRLLRQEFLHLDEVEVYGRLR